MFKIGDKVKCINSSGTMHLEKGNIYTVRYIQFDHDIKIDQNPYPYNKNRFELYNDGDKMKKVFRNISDAELTISRCRNEIDILDEQILIAQEWIKQHDICADDIYPGAIFECIKTQNIVIVSDAKYNNLSAPKDELYVLTGVNDNPNEAWNAQGGKIFTLNELMEYLRGNTKKRKDLKVALVITG